MKHIQIIFISFLLIILNYALFNTTSNQFASTDNIIELQRTILNIRIYLILIIVLSLFSYRKFIAQNQNLKLSENTKAKLFSVIISITIFYAFELYFSFKTKSHAIGYSYAGKLWKTKYWNPINANGFRDKTIQQNANNKTIFFIGDSFTEGHGIDNIDDRYSDIIKKALPNYNVYNLGINGIGTLQETKILTFAPIKPNIVFWQYFSNDIDELLQKYGYSYSFNLYNDVNSIIRKIVKSSFLFNYVYWAKPHKDTQNYLDGLSSGIKNKELIKEHLQNCDLIINYCSENHIKLVFIAFPLFIVDEKNPFNTHAKFMLDYVASKSVETINVDSLTKDLKVEEKVVNNFDAHASKLVNKRIADFILKKNIF